MTIPAMTLKGVLSILGVFSAARRRPSMAISSRRNWNTREMLTVSRRATNRNISGSHSRFCIKSRNTGVRNTVRNVMTPLENFR